MNTLDALTVGELMEELRNYDKDTPVVSCISYGDRVSTMQAIPASQVNEAYISKTAYSETGFKVVEEGDEEDHSEKVIVLNYDYL